jgi:hypothetical protein
MQSHKPYQSNMPLICINKLHYSEVKTKGDKLVPRTSLNVQMSTRDKLVAIGKKNESYDDIILRLLESYETSYAEDKPK